MKKQLYFAVLLMLAIILSAGVVCASDVNVTGSYAASLVDDAEDVSISNGNGAGSSEILASNVSNVDNGISKVSLSSEEVLESDNSNTLSTNRNNNSEESFSSYAGSDRFLLGVISEYVASEFDSKNLTDIENGTLAASNAKTDMVISAVYNAAKNEVEVTLTNDVTGKTIQNANVKVSLNGETTAVKSNCKGKAVISTADLPYGTYNATISYGGNVKYNPSSKSIKFTISKAGMIISAVYDDNNKSIMVTLTNNVTCKYIANANVKVSLNGETTAVKSDGEGQVVISTADLPYGTYNATISYGGNVKYNPSSKSIKFTPKTDMIISAVYDADNKNIVATLTNSATGNIIQNESVNVNINGKTNSIKSNGNGQVIVSAADLPVGEYAATISYNGSVRYLPANVTVEIIIRNDNIDYATGYFVFGSNMKDVDLNYFASTGVTDLFLNYYAFEKHGGSAVETWIANANKLGIRVHIWMQVFYEGKWINPVLDGFYNTKFSNEKIAEAEYYAKIKGVSGVLLDYLRYPGTAYKTTGGTDAITKFTKLVTDAIHKVNPALIVSVTLMPETTSSAYYYGQDYSAISSYVDAVLPMIYKGNYGKSTSWIKTTAQWYADNSKGAKVWAVLQAYKSDDDVTKLSVSELTTDAKNAVSGGSDGVVLFRYGLTNFINFNDLGISSSSSSSSSKGPATISINDILTGANNLKNYYSSNGVYPSTVTAAGHAFTIPEFLYLMSQAAYQLGNSNNNAITCIYGVKVAPSPFGDSINAQLYRNDYLTVAKNLANYIKTNNQAPNYASSAVGKISYNVLPDAFSRILAFYKNNDKYMPNYCTIVQSSGSSSSSSYTVGGMNVKNTITNLDAYYKATTNCQVNNAAIKNLVNSLTSGLTTDKEKATVLFNYVRDKIAYSYYYDTKYGAVGTLNAKNGNCVDQAHLLIAMYRAAGLAARYEHGTCYFTLSGNTYGHVWTQVLIDNVWVVGDPTSERNSFGKVVSWNTNSYTHHAYYASLPF